MNASTSLSVPISVFAILGVLIAGGAVVAQEQANVTDDAPYHVAKMQVGRGVTGAPIYKLSLTQVVSFQDLDLKKASDVSQLQSRVKEAARKGCAMIAQSDPAAFWADSDRRCALRATNEALAQVDAAVAAANR